MKEIILLNKSELKDIISALNRIKFVINSNNYAYGFGEIEDQLERIEKIFNINES